MIIFRDIVTGVELFTDTNKIEKPDEFAGEVLKVTCVEVRDEQDNNFDIGANASQEEQAEELETCVKQGVDIVIRQNLDEVTHLYDKAKVFAAGMKCYLKCAGKCLKKAKREVDQKKVAEGFKNFTDFVKANFDDIQFFTPPRNDCDNDDVQQQEEQEPEPEPMIIPLYRNPNNQEITMYFLNCALVEEKA